MLYRAWPDHKEITREMVDSLMRKAKKRQADVVLITAKDAVKWPKRLPDDLDVVVVETVWSWREGKDSFDKALQGLAGEPLN